jgi:plastocyanin
MKRAIQIMISHRLSLIVTAIAIVSLLLTSCGRTEQYSISGQVSAGGSGLPGVTMMLSGAAISTVTTDTSGNYTFNGLGNGNYTITPSKTGFIFNPTNDAQTIKSVNITAFNFTATAFPTFSISGTVTSGGSGLSDVTMMLNGADSDTVTTDASGNYTFSGLGNGNYAITPSKTGFAFSPTSSSQTLSGTNITAVNFTATPVSTFSIYGTVTSGGSELSGATMTLSGAGSAATTTDANGNYTFSALANLSYSITPSKTGFTFSPTSSSQTLSGANITFFNFIATSTQTQIVPCPSSGMTNVTIQDYYFTPLATTINVNGIVKLTNNGPSTHTVTSGTTPNKDGKFNSGNLGSGANFCVQFVAAGVYPYFSITDPSMTGSFTVQ